MVASCLPVYFPSSQDYELTNGQRYFYALHSLSIQQMSATQYLVQISKICNFQVYKVEIIIYTLLYDPIWYLRIKYEGKTRDCLEMHNDNELQMLGIVHL